MTVEGNLCKAGRAGGGCLPTGELPGKEACAMKSIKYDKTAVKGMHIRIGAVNVLLIVITCVLSTALLLITIHTSRKYVEMDESARAYIELEKQATTVKDASDYLTEQVRLFVQTADPEYMTLYFEEANVSKRREHALEKLETYHLSDRDGGGIYMQEAVRHSRELMKREIYAMRLTAESAGFSLEFLPEEVRNIRLEAEDQVLSPAEQAEKARGMLFDAEYQQTKSVIYANLDHFLEIVAEYMEVRLLGGLDKLSDAISVQQVLILMIVAVIAGSCVIIAFFVIRPLRICLRCVSEESMIEVTGAYEFRRIAEVYNDIYRKNQASAANEAFLKYKAEHDPMTGLLNRSAFSQITETLSREKVALALLIIDVDEFKQVNDQYGHGVGDCVLMRISELLKENFLSQDYLFRIGGDEFAGIIIDVTEEQKEMIAGRIQNLNDELQKAIAGMPRVSLSVGVTFSREGYDKKLYQESDQALYWMKNHGRCGCHFYQDEM